MRLERLCGVREGQMATQADIQQLPPVTRFPKKYLLIVLSCALLGMVVLFASYLVQRRSLAYLPGVGEVLKTVPPRYLSSLTGNLSPLAVAVSPSGDRVYVGESTGERQIRIFDRAGTAVGAFAPPDSEKGKRLPTGIAVANNGRVYVADRLRGAIDMYDPDGAYRGRFVPQTITAWLPVGVTVDGEGSVYVTDTSAGYHRVLVFRQNGSLKLSAGREGEGEGELSFPFAAAVDAKLNLFVSDGNNGRIAVFNRDGVAAGSFAAGTQDGSIGLPRGIAFDPRGRLHVVDTSNHAVYVYDVSANPPQFLYSFGNIGIGDGEFRFPNGLAIDDAGRVYVTDRENHRVHVWSY